MLRTRRILYLDDHPAERARLSRSLRRLLPDLEVVPIASVEELAQALTHPDFALLLCDPDLRWGDSRAVLAVCQERAPGMPVVFCSRHADPASIEAAVNAGAAAYLLKGGTALAQLRAALQSILQRAEHERRAAARLRQANRRLVALAEAGHAFAEARLDIDAIAARLAQQAATLIGDTVTVEIWRDGQSHVHVATASQLDAALQQEIAEAAAVAPLLPGTPISERVLASGEPIYLPEAPAEQLLALLKPAQRPLAARLGLAGLLAVPLRSGGQPLGVVMAVRHTPGRPYGEDDLALLHDLADRAALAIDNALLYLAAQEGVLARDRLLSIAAHELRTPLTAIKGMAQLLLRLETAGRLSHERLREGLRSIDAASDRLNRLVGDLLDVSRLRVGRLALAFQPLDLRALVQEVVARCASATGVTIVSTLPPRACPVRADPGRLEQVLVNLLDNAVKYSAGRDPIEVVLQESEGGYQVSVRDHGIGVPPGMLERIFEPFARAENAINAQLPGLGLGLFLARQLVEQHGGRISAESAGDSEGTTVHLWLPAAAG
ncbi:MAG: GAF domain-containing protein [Chloroflexi bacterium]|nr:GAF domain-containing protein [Chloroflexota bacterium]